MNRRLKKFILIVLNVILTIYLLMAITSFNNPKETHPICSEVKINIEDETTNGFLSKDEVKIILEKNRLYPDKKKMINVNPRAIEDCKTGDGKVFIGITQRLPIVRIKNQRGDDYYLDDHGGIMPNSKYTSDLIIATGNINAWYAKNYLVYLAIELMNDDFWKNQIVQINILPDLGVELVPRVGEHVVYIGQLPYANDKIKRKELIKEFIRNKTERLEMFYKYGLNKAGWNKYYYINIEFDNQIICKKKVNDKIIYLYFLYLSHFYQVMVLHMLYNLLNFLLLYY